MAKLKDLVTDNYDRLSHTKLMNILGFLVTSGIYIYQVVYNIPVSWEVMLAFGCLSSGPRVMSKLLDVVSLKKE